MYLLYYIILLLIICDYDCGLIYPHPTLCTFYPVTYLLPYDITSAVNLPRFRILGPLGRG